MKKDVISRKKAVTIALLLCIVLSLCACGGGGTPLPGPQGTDSGDGTETVRNTAGSYPVIPETDLSPEEFIAENYQNLLQHGDGGWTARIFFQGSHYLAPTFLPMEALDESWEKIGTTKPPVYPWEKREEDFVTNCVPEGCDVFLKEEEYRTLIAVKVDGKYYVFQ